MKLLIQPSIVCLLFVFQISMCVEFDVIPYVERCIKQEFPHDSLVSGRVVVTPPVTQHVLWVKASVCKHTAD